MPFYHGISVVDNGMTHIHHCFVLGPDPYLRATNEVTMSDETEIVYFVPGAK